MLNGYIYIDIEPDLHLVAGAEWLYIYIDIEPDLHLVEGAEWLYIYI